MIKYIFAISTGRSGSGYLAKVFYHYEGVASFHEPDPVMNGKPMFDYLRGNSLLLEKMIDTKIRNIVIAKEKSSVYIETNHCFIKGFGWLLALHIPDEEMGVIFIKRTKDEIINSLFRISCTPLSKAGINWIITPLVKDPICKIELIDRIKFYIYRPVARFLYSKYNMYFKFKVPKFIKNYELKMLDWYVDETYALGEKFKNDFPKVKVIETTTQRLNDWHEIERIINFFDLDITPKASAKEVIGVPINLKR